METPDLTQSNIEKLATLFPSCITEAQKGGQLWATETNAVRCGSGGRRSLRIHLGGQKGRHCGNQPPHLQNPTALSRGECQLGHTENLYIEGDNLEVLKLLQESYLGKVKMIYI